MSQSQKNSIRENGNDLTAIKGIGQARQRWFKESLNVYTYRDLAALSVEDIESRLKAEGRITSRNDIEQWIAQARDRAIDEPQGQSVKERTNREPVIVTNAPPLKDGWKPFASFVVEFRERHIEDQIKENQTIVHHVEADKNETWPGLEKEQLCRWMMDQIGGNSLLEDEDSDGADVKEIFVESIPTVVEIVQVQAYQPPDSENPTAIGTAGQIFVGSVKGNEPFSLVAFLEFFGPGSAYAVNGERQYQAQFYASSLSGGQEIHLGDSEPEFLLKEQSSYRAILSNITLTPRIYRLRVIAKLQGTSRWGFAQMGLLQVA